MAPLRRLKRANHPHGAWLRLLPAAGSDPGEIELGEEPLSRRAEVVWACGGPAGLEELRRQHRGHLWLIGWRMFFEGDLDSAAVALSTITSDRLAFSEVLLGLALLRSDPAAAVSRLRSPENRELRSLLEPLLWVAQHRAPSGSRPSLPAIGSDLETVGVPQLFWSLAIWWTYPEQLAERKSILRRCREAALAAGYARVAFELQSLLAVAGLENGAEPGFALHEVLRPVPPSAPATGPAPPRAGAALTDAPDVRARLLLTPARHSRFKIQIRARPLGDGGVAYPPGVGPERVTEEESVIERDLRAERKQARALRGSLTTLPQAGWQWELGLEACLALVEELSEREDVLVEWPAGKPLSLRTSSPVLRVSARQQQDWFVLEGELEVDENLSVELSRLLRLWTESPGRFLRLGQRQFLVLSEHLRRQLHALNQIGEVDGGRVRVHPFASRLLDVSGDAAWAEQKEKFRSAELTEVSIPKDLRVTLRAYQKEGFRWMARLAQLGAGACLADDMGLGKTVQTLALLALRAELGPALVVAPTSVGPNWMLETAGFVPRLRIHRLPAGGREELVHALGPWDVLFVSYGLLNADALALRSWSTLVLDEAQSIKNYGARRTRAALHLSADFRLATTGTPVENHLAELWSLFRFLNPGLLGSLRSFLKRCPNDVLPPELRRALRPFILRRTKAQVLSELPPRTEVVVHVELPDQERAFYRKIFADAVALVENTEVSRAELLNQLTRLRLACCHPALVAAGIPLRGAKLEALLRLVDKLRAGGHRCLVFSQFTTMLGKVRRALIRRGVHFCSLDGSLSSEQRQQQVLAFQEGSAPVFLISLRAGSTGINLTAADHVIHLNPWWNPAVEDQASDRAHRLGQTRPVTVYRLINRGTVEEKIMRLHERKRKLFEDLLRGSDGSARLTREDLLELLRD